GDRRARPSGSHDGRGLAEIEPCVDCRGAGWRRHIGQRVLLRWRHGYCCLRAARWDPGTRTADARQTEPQSTGFSPQQRQCLPRPTEGMAASLPWRRHEKPAELSRLAPDSGGPGTADHTASDDPRGNRTGTISTNNAIRAIYMVTHKKIAHEKGICTRFITKQFVIVDETGLPYRVQAAF